MVRMIWTISPDDMHSEQWQVCLHIFCDMGIGYMALWGFGAKSWMNEGWTVMTSRAPVVLKSLENNNNNNINNMKI